MNRKIAIIFISFLFSFSAAAGPLLLMDSLSARDFALAQADMLTRNDLDALSVNPAGLSDLDRFSAGIFYLPWYDNMDFFSVTAAYPLIFKITHYGTLGLGYSSFSTDPFPNYDSDANALTYISTSDSMLNLAYGISLLRKWSLGFNAKYYYTRLWDYEVRGITADLGSVLVLNFPHLGSKRKVNNLGLGVIVQNFGFKQTLIEEEVELPFKVKAGLNYGIYSMDNFNLILLAGVTRRKDYDPELSSGVEMELFNLFVLRGGYQVLGNTDISLSAGAGLKTNIQNQNIIIDYAFIPLRNLGVQHAFSLKAKFGK